MKLLIVWYSRTGASRALAQACYEAAAAEFDRIATDQLTMPAVNQIDPRSEKVRCLRCDEVSLDLLLEARGYIFVCPENLGSMAGLMKEFFDRHYYSALDQLQGRPSTAMISAGSDGQGAVRQIERIATGWRLKKIADAFVCNLGAQTKDQIESEKHLSGAQRQVASDLGQSFAAGLSLGVF